MIAGKKTSLLKVSLWVIHWSTNFQGRFKGVKGNELTQKRKTGILVPAPLLTSSMPWGKSLSISGLCFLACRTRKWGLPKATSYRIALNKFGELINIIETDDYVRYPKKQRRIRFYQSLLIGKYPRAINRLCQFLFLFSI